MLFVLAANPTKAVQVRGIASGRTTVMLSTLAIILAIVGEITVLQAEETNLAHIQVSTMPSTTTSIPSTSSTSLHNVTFVVSSQCGGRPSGWAISKWGVTFDNVTKTYPSDANLSLIQQGDFALGVSNQSSITFAVPDGNYSYQLYPNASGASDGPLEVSAGPLSEYQARGASGVITVNGFNLEFCLSYPAIVA